jgi:hypothetical protein
VDPVGNPTLSWAVFENIFISNHIDWLSNSNVNT